MNLDYQLHELVAVLELRPSRVIACSGGVDSLLLADISHDLAAGATTVVHSVTPAVPPAATRRVEEAAQLHGWDLQLIESKEFDDPRYMTNPINRCFFCKENLYEEIHRRLDSVRATPWHVLSGTNTDDLADFRPGLLAAASHQVVHPYVEAGINKEAIRAIARFRGRDWTDLAASPCLASRLYTGTSVRSELLRAIDAGETFIRGRVDLPVVRCRVRGTAVLVELPAMHRKDVSPELLAETLLLMQQHDSELSSLELDPEPYRPGRSFVALESFGGSHA